MYCFRDIQCPICLSGWIAAVSVRLFVAHPERYHYLAILGETPPEHLSLATKNAKSLLEEQSDEEETVEEDIIDPTISDEVNVEIEDN